MTQNDFLRFLLDRSPVVVALAVWAWGYGSLLLIAVKTDSIRTLLRHPGFTIGDFFLLPLAAGLMTWFYHSVEDPVPVTQRAVFGYVMAVAAGVATFLSATRIGYFSPWLLPHLAFYWFMSYVALTFFAKGAVQLTSRNEAQLLWLLWGASLLAIIVHLLLGVIFGPKRLPQP